MERGKKIGKVIGIFLLAILLVAAIILVAYRDVTVKVFYNLTAPKFDLAKEDVWDGGEELLQVPYCDQSQNQWLNLYLPDGQEKAPLLIIVHGGGFVFNDATSRQARLMYDYFRDQGFACASINYRLAQEAKYPAALEDVKAAVRFLRVHADQYGYDPDRFFIFGESAGGYLATMAALTNDEEFMGLSYIGQEEAEKNGKIVSAKVAGLIDYYGVVDMANVQDDWKTEGLPNIVYQIANSWATKAIEGSETIEGYWIGKEFTDMSQEEIDQITPLYYLQKNFKAGDPLKIYIVHGDADITVPITQSERFFELAKKTLGAGGKAPLAYYTGIHCGHADDRLYDSNILGDIKRFLLDES